MTAHPVAVIGAFRKNHFGNWTWTTEFGGAKMEITCQGSRGFYLKYKKALFPKPCGITLKLDIPKKPSRSTSRFYQVKTSLRLQNQLP